ncbi:hypothetical protein MMC09_007104 [Bachmanniomyces sp. S44760]|nr:hypothetical protein [Bachmanniomyces sp. S44760]
MKISMARSRVFALILLASQQAVAQISRTGWTLTVDTAQSGNPATNAIDGNSATFWHSEYTPTLTQLPHTMTIDMKSSHNIDQISYQPRQDGNSNGNIGQHKIYVSTDGVNFGNPVALGTYYDDASTKTTTFVPRPARYVRIVAITEAGNRGPWTSMAEINVFAATTYTAPSSTLGQWAYTIDFPIVPVAASLDHNSGNVLVWSSYKYNDFTGDTGTGVTLTATYNMASQVVSERTITNTQHDMFCPGISVDATGRTIVTGGNSASKTSIYDPTQDAWISAANMNIGRGYQASATCSDGRIFTIGGSWSGGEGGKNGEIYSPSANTWTLLPGADVAAMLTADAQGVYRADNHGWLFGWKNGSVFQAGPSKAMNWYSTAGSGGQVAAGLRATDGDSMCGNAVMYDAVAGKILTAGGSPSYQDSDATSNVHIITIGNAGSSPTVSTQPSMSYTRAFANGIVLPDGTVFVAGGQSYAVPFTDTNSQLTPELFNPKTNTWKKLNPNITPRNYHSIGLLLPDATVLIGGGGLCGNSCPNGDYAANHFDAEIFKPPYLFNTDGSAATRPVISSISPASVAVGGKITITMAAAGTYTFAMTRGDSATHTVHTDQRRVPLTPIVSGTTYSVTVPSDSGIALPGYWLVWAINSAGVPALAQTVLVHT